MIQPNLSPEVVIPLPPRIGVNAVLLDLNRILLEHDLSDKKEPIKIPLYTHAQLQVNSPPRYSVPYSWQRYEGTRGQWPKLDGSYNLFGLILLPGKTAEVGPRAVFGAVHSPEAGNVGVLLGRQAVNGLANVVGLPWVYAAEI